MTLLQAHQATAEGKVCGATGLLLVRSRGRAYRIGKSKYDQLKPPMRGSGADRDDWGRWDSPGGSTIYLASSIRGAFGEVLPYLSNGLPQTPLSDLFDDVDPGDTQTLDRAVAHELPALGPCRAVTQGWRLQRNIYVFDLPDDGWFIDIQAAESIAAINDWRLGDGAPADRLTVSELTGKHRFDTTTIAGWVRSRVLDDGTLPLGIRYLSKHGTNLVNYAYWPRALDDGKTHLSEPLKLVEQYAVRKDDHDLSVAAGWSKLKVF